MSSSAREDVVAVDIGFTPASLEVDLSDGRRLSVPLSWYPRLLDASPGERADWRFLGGGAVIHWPQIDEDLSTTGLLAGAPAPGHRQATGS